MIFGKTVRHCLVKTYQKRLWYIWVWPCAFWVHNCVLPISFYDWTQFGLLHFYIWCCSLFFLLIHFRPSSPSSLSRSCRSRSLLISFSSCLYFRSMKRFWWAIWGKLSARREGDRNTVREWYSKIFQMWNINLKLFPLMSQRIEKSAAMTNSYGNVLIFWQPRTKGLTAIPP